MAVERKNRDKCWCLNGHSVWSLPMRAELIWSTYQWNSLVVSCKICLFNTAAPRWTYPLSNECKTEQRADIEYVQDISGQTKQASPFRWFQPFLHFYFCGIQNKCFIYIYIKTNVAIRRTQSLWNSCYKFPQQKKPEKIPAPFFKFEVEDHVLFLQHFPQISYPPIKGKVILQMFCDFLYFRNAVLVI